MRTYPECIPCILKASLNAGRLGGAGEEELWQAIEEAAVICGRWEKERPPIALGASVAAVLRATLGGGDPFSAAKREANAKLWELHPALRARVHAAPDPLDEALRIAAAANALDLGVHREIDFIETLKKALASPRGRWDLHRFKAHLMRAGKVLYLADNAGEIVADLLLIEEFLAQGKEVTLAVRGGPILNDVTLKDLEGIDLPEGVEVMTTGVDLPGVSLPLCSREFQEEFKKAELVVSKGMGNFEGLSDESGPIFSLLQAKCFPVAQEIGVNVGELVLLAPHRRG